MPAKKVQDESDGFSAEERAEGKKADGLQAVLDSIAEMTPEDRALVDLVKNAIS